MFLLLMSVTFYRCIQKMHSKSVLPHFSAFEEILLKSCRKSVVAYVCKLNFINFLMGFKIWGFSWNFLPSITTFSYHLLFILGQRTKAAASVPF